ncbi:MAG: hypothetical protein OEY14_05500 [Myxococcales bacterium]|nr:hypothetical protein [Myxococcales bacterium]
MLLVEQLPMRPSPPPSRRTLPRSGGAAFLLCLGLLGPLGCGSDAPAPVPGPRWPIVLGGSSLDSLYGLEVDEAGSAYVLAKVSDPAGARDRYVQLAAFSAEGEALWSRRLDEVANVWALERDGRGQLYITLTLGTSFAIDGRAGPGSGPHLLRFSEASGALEGSLALGETSLPYVATSRAGSIYLVGFTLNPTRIGALTVQGAYVAGLDSSLQPRWAQSLGICFGSMRRFAATDEAGHLYVSGVCRGPVDLGAGPFGGDTEVQQILVSWDLNGGLRWDRVLGQGEFHEDALRASDGLLYVSYELSSSVMIDGQLLAGGSTQLLAFETSGGALSADRPLASPALDHCLGAGSLLSLERGELGTGTLTASTLGALGAVSAPLLPEGAQVFERIGCAPDGTVWVGGVAETDLDFGFGVVPNRGARDVFLMRL